jgi:RNA polymerase sigma-70 factor (ECF subfamily)
MHESALIRKAQEGDAVAFETLLGIYYDRVFKFAYKWCGGREDAEDITQQTCIKLARAIGQYRFDAAFSSWLYRIVINCAKDWQRSQRRYSGESGHPEDEGQMGSVGQTAENELLVRQILGQLDKMPDGIKETVMLVHGAGYTHGEAAEILSVKESTVSWRLHEARKQLRLTFGQEAIYD